MCRVVLTPHAFLLRVARINSCGLAFLRRYVSHLRQLSPGIINTHCSTTLVVIPFDPPFTSFILTDSAADYEIAILFISFLLYAKFQRSGLFISRPSQDFEKI
jgi:hypothetical protein